MRTLNRAPAAFAPCRCPFGERLWPGILVLVVLGCGCVCCTRWPGSAGEGTSAETPSPPPPESGVPVHEATPSFAAPLPEA